MANTHWSQSLIGKPLNSIRPLFASLYSPEVGALSGVYRAEFVGPGWLRQMAPTALALGGLAGWWGKVFDGQGGATNIVQRGDARCRVLPMTVVSAVSLVDGKPCLTLRYGKDVRFPWPWIVDEVRRLDEMTLLCVTLVNLSWAPKLPFPFLLQQAEG